ncbi:MAG: GGDEF domain-containing protein [Gemmatimonadota bacterium]|nr:GGDEF domain-containing protein [Gemmatimonadota bacterium]
MSASQSSALIAFIGVVVQLGGSLLLAILFVLLHRSQRRRAYFGLWARAWVALAVAISAVFLRYLMSSGGTPPEDVFPVRTLYFAYQFGKILHYALLAAATLMYARSLRWRYLLPGVVIGSALYALLTLAASSTLNEVVLLQAPAAMLSLCFCASALLRLPLSRRTLGSRLTGSLFALTALLWTAYLAAFHGVQEVHTGAWSALERVAQLNSYLDLILSVCTGFGMVIILMEDARRESDDAHAELAVAHNQLRRTALYDPLTGVLNRRGFVHGVGLENARAGYGTVIMLDLDNLKLVNDGCGHAAGDALLCRLAEVLLESLRPSDRLYRWGGDEFLLVLPGAPAADMLARVERIIADAPPAHVEGAPTSLRLLVSVGASDYSGAEDLERAIADADRAMYQYKHGRKSAPTLAVQLELQPVAPARS